MRPDPIEPEVEREKPHWATALVRSFTFDYSACLDRSAWLPILPILLLVAATGLAGARQMRRWLGDEMPELARAYGENLKPVRFERAEDGEVLAVADQDEPIQYAWVRAGRSFLFILDTKDRLERAPEEPHFVIWIQSRSSSFSGSSQPTQRFSNSDLLENLEAAGLGEISRESIADFHERASPRIAAAWGIAILAAKAIVSRPLTLLLFSLLALVVSEIAGRGLRYGTIARICLYALVPLSAADLLLHLRIAPPLGVRFLGLDEAVTWGIYGLYVFVGILRTAAPTAPE